jgi:hypothetical protein
MENSKFYIRAMEDNGKAPNTDGITIIRDGSVGVGTSTPDAKLDVAGNVMITAGGNYKLTSGSYNLPYNSNVVTFDTTAWNNLVNSGNLVPGGAIWFANQDTTYPGFGDEIASVGNKQITLRQTNRVKNNAGSGISFNQGNSDFYINKQSLMVGNPDSDDFITRIGGAGMVVNDKVSAKNVRAVYTASNGYARIISTGGLSVFIDSDNSNPDSDPDDAFRIYKNRPNLDASHLFNVKSDGNAWLLDTLTEKSDIRLKKDVVQIDNALNKVMQLNGVYFNWKDESMDQSRHVGLIAQEVEKVLPELVSTDEEGYKSVAYTKTVAVLVEAVKEQQKMIEQQQKEIDELKARLK